MSSEVPVITEANGKQYSKPYLYYVLFILFLAYVFNFVDRQLVTILVEPIKEEFGATDTQMGFLTGLAFALFYATLGVPVARLADSWSRRNVLSLSIATWSAMTAVCGFASSFWQLAAARVGVGVGEAGGSPPSHALISDYFPPHQRSTALGVFSSATHFGVIVGMLGGALIAQAFGWRMAFIALGLPGVILALIVWLTVDEPLRGRWDPPRKAGLKEESFAEVVRYIWRSRAFRLVALATGFTTLSGYGFGNWTPSFLIRVHGLSLVEAGLLLGVAGTLGGLLGAIFGGIVTDRMARRDSSWQLKMPALGALISMPLQMLFLMWPERQAFHIGDFTIPVAVLFMPVGAFFAAFWIGPTYAAVQNLVKPNMRSLASATLLLFLNLIGMGIGPLLVGVLSDALLPSMGVESIRYALLYSLVTVLIGSALFWRASIHYRHESVASAVADR